MPWEFRVFLPLLRSPHSDSTKSPFDPFISRALVAFDAVELRAVERRSDQYLLGCSASCGVKLRHGSDLEIKYRLQCSSQVCGLEMYKKHASRSELSQAAPAILSSLQSFSILSPTDAITFSAPPRWLTIDKSRRSERLSSAASLEIARLQVQKNDQSVEEWLSIAVEANSEADVIAALSSPVLLERFSPLYAAMEQCINEYERSDGLSVSLCVCGGYPSFIRVVGDCASSDERRTMIENVRALVTAFSLNHSKLK
jgi:hypothetical protein